MARFPEISGLWDIAGAVTVTATSGGATGEQLPGPVAAGTSSGSILLRYILLHYEVPQAVVTEANSENSEFTVPRGQPDRGDSGSRNIAVADDPAASHVLVVGQFPQQRNVIVRPD